MKRAIELLKFSADIGFFHLLLTNFLLGFIGFGSQLFIAKIVSPLELGQLTTLQSLITTLTVCACFGFNTAVLKLCSEKRPADEKSFILSKIFVFSIFPILIVLALSMICSHFHLVSPDTTINSWMPIFALVIPPLVYTKLSLAYLQALKKFQLIAKLQVFIRIIGIIIILTCAFKYGFKGVLISSIFVGYIATLPLLVSIKDSLFKNTTLNSQVTKKILSYAKWSFGANALNILQLHMDIFMLNYLVTDRITFGYYSLAATIIFGLHIFPVTVQTITTPFFSENSENPITFKKIFIKYQRIMTIISCLLVFFFFFAIPKLIIIIYGTSYMPSVYFFKLLLFRYFFTCLASLSGVAIIGLGKFKYNFLLVSITVPCSIIFNFVFIKNWGISGAALAQILVSIFILILTFVFLYRLIGAPKTNNSLS